MRNRVVCLLIIVMNSGNRVHFADSFSVSVPATRSVCKSMKPGHDQYKPQASSSSPGNVTTDITQVRGGETVDVTIYARNGEKFKGFYIQARDEKGAPIGTFNENTYVKTHSCGGIKSNAAHHVNSEDKTKVQVSWTAPANYNGRVQILATIVQRFNTYWTGIKANAISVVG
ncbi:putative defense protein isoform X2 [Folsomia candida]|uniref:Putative ferric-chelate reductase 1 n=1 Tax=Folsomia candida TaxID=158441 RepID=A0A226DL20_FOLCA|nr:putative defense protein isoform X2 [Folsomia candida]OXA44906.1 putative ferric-chelate reductase 1 [Folsomia candida]